MEARKLKNYMNANGAAYFLDSSFDVFKKKTALNETENLFLLQKRIVKKKKKSLSSFYFHKKFTLVFSQCENLKNFLPPRFYAKSNLANY